MGLGELAFNLAPQAKYARIFMRTMDRSATVTHDHAPFRKISNSAQSGRFALIL